jgi:hypothetical protein
MVPSQRKRMSRETSAGIIYSLLIHALLLGLLFSVRWPPFPSTDRTFPIELRIQEKPRDTAPALAREVRKEVIRSPKGGRVLDQSAAPQAVEIPQEAIIPGVPPDSSAPAFQALPPFSDFTFALIDSLIKVYPALKHALLRETIIRSSLKDDSLQEVSKRRFVNTMAELKLYGELEAEARHNQAMFGVPYNPMRSPHAPNQVDLIALARLIANVLGSMEGK